MTLHASRPTLRSAAPLIVFILAASLLSIAPPAEAEARVFAADSFGRRVTDGWSYAERGGSWAPFGPRGDFSVDGSAGRIVSPAGGEGREALLPAVTPRDVDITTRVSTDRTPTGWGQLAALITRSVADHTEYRGRLRVAPDGQVHLAAVKVVGSAREVEVTPEVAVPGLRRAVGAFVRVRAQVVGSNPTTIRLRAWADGQLEPTSWHVSATDREAALQGSGAVGLRAALSSSATNAPIATRFDDLRVTSPDSAVTTTSTSTSLPSGSRFVSPSGSDGAAGTQSAPWRTVQHAVNSVSSGTTIVLRAGTYREQVQIYGKALTLQAYPGEQPWLTGSDVVTGWVGDGSAWRKDGWTAEFNNGGLSSTYIDSNPLAGEPDMVFVNGVPLRQVGSRSQVAPGTFYVDDGGNRLYVGDNPSGKTVEASTRRRAVWLNRAHGTALKGLGIRHYANTVWELGVVKGDAARLVFEGNTFADNAAMGLTVLQPDAVVRNNVFTGNGQLGLHGHNAHRLRVEGNRFVGNNRERFRIQSAQGGLKVTSSRDMVWRDNVVERNFGRGMWCDESCYNITIVRNTVRDNQDRGIQYELSARAVIASNVVTGNGDAGIMVLESSDIDVYNNTLSRNLQNIRVFEGSRRSSADPAITWDVGDVVIRNNLLSNGTSRSVALFGVDNLGTKTAEQMGVSANYNGYYRTNSGSPSTLVQWARWPSTILMLRDLNAFRSATNQERNGLAVDSTSTNPFFANESGGDYRLRSGSIAIGRGAPLDERIANAIGVRAGVTVSLGALHL